MAEVVIRPATRGDAERLAELANASSVFEGTSESYSTEGILDDVFGSNPAFAVVVAVRDAEVIGFAAYGDLYNADHGIRGAWLGDLFVIEAARSEGIGRRLMAAVARLSVERGAQSLWWGVRSANREARAFYARLGARDEDTRILELDGEALARLAGSGAQPK